MITEKNKSLCDMTIEEIKASDLDVTVKEELISGLQTSLESCNGYSQEEKIKMNSENNFSVMRILSHMMIQLNKVTKNTSWTDVLIKCKWQAMTLGIVVAIVCAFRPELAGILTKLI